MKNAWKILKNFLLSTKWKPIFGIRRTIPALSLVAAASISSLAFFGHSSLKLHTSSFQRDDISSRLSFEEAQTLMNMQKKEGNLKKITFEIISKELDHLRLFHKLVEGLNIKKSLYKANILDSKRIVSKESVVYYLSYYSLLPQPTECQIILIADIESKKYTLIFESTKGELGKLEAEIIMNAIDRKFINPEKNFEQNELQKCIKVSMISYETNPYTSEHLLKNMKLENIVKTIVTTASNKKTEPLISVWDGPKNCGKSECIGNIAKNLQLPIINILFNPESSINLDELKQYFKERLPLITRKIGDERIIFFLDNLENIVGPSKIQVLSTVAEAIKESHSSYLLILSQNSGSLEREAKLVDFPYVTFTKPSYEDRKTLISLNAKHLTATELEELAKKTDQWTTKQVVNFCRNVTVYWMEHYHGSSISKLSPPFSVYLERLPKSSH